MGHSVFVDKIGKVFDGDYNDAIENYENYKDLSQRGASRFSEKNVYLLDGAGSIIKSFGATKFEGGGAITKGNDFIKDFIIGKRINKKDLGDDYSVVEDSNNGSGSSTLIHKAQGGEYPLISKKSKSSAVFHKRNFSTSDFINELADRFRDICIKNAIQFEIK